MERVLKAVSERILQKVLEPIKVIKEGEKDFSVENVDVDSSPSGIFVIITLRKEEGKQISENVVIYDEKSIEVDFSREVQEIGKEIRDVFEKTELTEEEWDEILGKVEEDIRKMVKEMLRGSGIELKEYEEDNIVELVGEVMMDIIDEVMGE